jgi:hypothetical protein
LAHHEPLAELDRGAAVEPLVRVRVQVQKRFENVEHAGHLREEQDAVAAALQIPQQGRQHLFFLERIQL